MSFEIVKAALAIGAVSLGIPAAIDVVGGTVKCEATPQVIEQVMYDMLPVDYIGDREALKQNLIASLSHTTDCVEMTKAIQTNIISQAMPDEMKPKADDDKITFQNDAEALEYFRAKGY